jgi:transcription elongation factor Elf1
LANVFEDINCPQCGYKNPGINLFCKECGAYLKMEGKSLMMDSGN